MDMTGCEHGIDTAAWVLGALDERAAAAFAEHLRTCADCQAEVARLRAPADAMALATEQVAPPPALRDRIMRTVESEAQLLRAAGPEADRPHPVRRERRRFFRTGPVAALAAATLAVGIAVGVLVSAGGESTRTVRASVTMTGASATVHVSGDRARLEVRGMRNPPPGHVYEVWVKRGKNPPQPAGALFTVLHGRGEVEVGSVKGVDQVMVTSEPAGGSTAPTSNPVITAAV
jgi:anti-sigma-K factor RskA